MERKPTWKTSHQHTWDNEQCSTYYAHNRCWVTHFQMNGLFDIVGASSRLDRDVALHQWVNGARLFE
jgi:hypothetical protein